MAQGCEMPPATLLGFLSSGAVVIPEETTGPFDFPPTPAVVTDIILLEAPTSLAETGLACVSVFPSPSVCTVRIKAKEAKSSSQDYFVILTNKVQKFRHF